MKPLKGQGDRTFFSQINSSRWRIVSLPPSLLLSLLPSPLPLPSLLLYPLFLPSPNSASLLATYLTHMGSWGVLCPFKATQLNLLPRKFHAARPEVSSFLLHPTLSHPWRSPLLMYYVSLRWTVSKASWQGLWDAVPPLPEEGEDLEQHWRLASLFLHTWPSLAFSSSSSCLSSHCLGYGCVSPFPALKSHLKSLSFTL